MAVDLIVEKQKPRDIAAPAKPFDPRTAKIASVFLREPIDMGMGIRSRLMRAGDPMLTGGADRSMLVLDLAWLVPGVAVLVTHQPPKAAVRMDAVILGAGDRVVYAAE